MVERLQGETESMKLNICKYHRSIINDLYAETDTVAAAILRKMLEMTVSEVKDHSAFN